MEDGPRKTATVEGVGGGREIEMRKADDGDLCLIQQWLIEEGEQESHAGILCNWERTKESYRQDLLIAAIDRTNGEPVAYLQGSLICPGAMHVKQPWRGSGVEERLVEFAADLALEADEMVLEVSLISETEVPFWQAMGFQFAKIESPMGRAIIGRRILSKRLDILPNGRKLNVEHEPLMTLNSGGRRICPHRRPEVRWVPSIRTDL